MQKNTEEKTQLSDSGKQLPTQDAQVTSENLLKNVSMQLYGLMVGVTKNEISPNTVNAACHCASEIHKLLKFNNEIKRG